MFGFAKTELAEKVRRTLVNSHLSESFSSKQVPLREKKRDMSVQSIFCLQKESLVRVQDRLATLDDVVAADSKVTLGQFQFYSSNCLI